MDLVDSNLNGTTLNTDANNTEETQYPKTTFYIIGEFCHQYLLPVVILTGLVGNTLSFLVFLQTHLRTLSSSVYLAALAVADTGFLLQLSLNWLGHFEINVFQANGPCQALVYLSYVCSFLSVWFVVSFTVERYVAVCHPLQRPKFCTTYRARVVVTCLSVFAGLIYSHVAWTSGIENNACVCKEKYCGIVAVLNNVDTVVTLILPSLLIIIMNTRIVCSFANSNNKMLQLHLQPLSEPTVVSRTEPEVERMLYHQPQQNLSYIRHRNQIKITKMLLVVSTIFLVLNLPSHAIRIIYFFGQLIDSNLVSESNAFTVIRQWQQLFIFVYYCNFAVNFLLYSLCGKNFRKALKRLCSKPRSTQFD